MRKNQQVFLGCFPFSWPLSRPPRSPVEPGFVIVPVPAGSDSYNDEAITHLKRAVAIDGEYTEALYVLSRGLAVSDPEGARMFAARLEALKRRGQNADQAKMLQSDASASASAGDWKESITRYNAALELCGECPLRVDLEKSLGLAYCHAGSPDLGEPHLLVAQKLRPGDPDIERSLALIAELRRKMR